MLKLCNTVPRALWHMCLCLCVCLCVFMRVREGERGLFTNSVLRTHNNTHAFTCVLLHQAVKLIKHCDTFRFNVINPVPKEATKSNAKSGIAKKSTNFTNWKVQITGFIISNVL